MAEQVVMPKQGNTVESCVILEWHKSAGDVVSVGDVLCEVESDKAAFEVESTAAGTLLKVYFDEGEDVPVLSPIAVVGEAGEEIPDAPAGNAAGDTPDNAPANAAGESGGTETDTDTGFAEAHGAGTIAASPRARMLAEGNGFDVSVLAGRGTGPGGRIIERDVRAALGSAAGTQAATQESTTARGAAGARECAPANYPGKVREIPLTGVRRIVAERMAGSLRRTAQLTLHASADARRILAYREDLKNSKKELGLRDITVNDLIFFAAVSTLRRYPALNAHFLGDKIIEFESVHAAFAVDTERGLMVPVIRFADELSLKDLAAETARLSKLCVYGGINPDDLSGGTFTVSNLGVLGVEVFTPILNPPQAAILGICNIRQKPVAAGGETVFRPHIGLSLTVDHQAVDGAPAARYLKSLCEAIASFELILAG